MAPLPSIKKYCGFKDWVFNVQTALMNIKIPSGPNRLTPNMARLSQSNAITLPAQNPENGHKAKAINTIANTISSHTNVFSIPVFMLKTQLFDPNYYLLVLFNSHTQDFSDKPCD